MTSPCRYVEAQGYLLASHMPTCRDRDCAGCQPCETDEHGDRTRHCTARRTCSEHLDDAHPLTCPRCIGRTRADLWRIQNLAHRMQVEAIRGRAAGVNSEAANLAGPAADYGQVVARKIGIRRAVWADATDPERVAAAIPDDDPHHPRAVLGRWDMMIREDGYGQPTRERITTGRAAAYLRSHLDALAQDPHQDWPLFASEIRTCRTHLEAVLHDSRTPERGAPCPTCAELVRRDDNAPRLVKRWAHWCTEDDCKREHDTTGAHDRWVCPANDRHRWTEAEYRQRVGGEYLANAEALTAAEIRDAWGIRPATLRSWAERGHVAKRGRNGFGQQTYDVDQALDQAARHDEETTVA